MPPLHDPIPYDRIGELMGAVEPVATIRASFTTPGASTQRKRRVRTRGRPSRSTRAGNSSNPAIGRLSTSEKSCHPGRTALAPRPAFSSSAHMPPYASVAARSKSNTAPQATAKTIRVDIDAEPKPRAILFDSHGEFMTGEAIRWCARYSINLALPGGPGRLITMVESALETKAKTMTRMRDVDPSIIRAQCAADPVTVAREIVRAKIRAELNATIPDAEARKREFEEWDIKLNSVRSVAEVMIVESRAAAAYWRAFRDVGLRERKNGNLPRSWLRFAQRNKGAAFLGNQHASHPINAMLNYCYIVEAGRLAKALAARGLALPIGYLHSDKKGRNSLVWDAIEPLRPAIDAKVFAFVEAYEFARSDFPQSGYNVHRLSRDVTQLLLHRGSLPKSEIEGTADWMVRTIVRCAAPREEIGRTRRRPLHKLEN